MVLSYSEIQGLLTGTLQNEMQADGLQLSRYTPTQLALHEDDPVLYLRATHTPSVTLDFYTDSEVLNLTVGGQREADDTDFSFDLFENGAMTNSFLQTFPLGETGVMTQVQPQEMHFKLCRGEKRVTVYFPWNLAAKIHKLELSDGAAFRPCEYAGKWLALGDSITHGCRAKHTSMTYVNQLSRMLGLEVLNHGIGGEVFHERNYLAGSYGKFDLITVAYGTNDFSRGHTQFFTQMPKFLKTLSEDNPQTPIAVILPLFRRLGALGTDKGIGTLEEVREHIRKEAAKYPNITLVEGEPLVPHHPDFYAEDFMLHPTDLGFSQYALNLRPILKNLLKEAAV